MLLKIYLDGYLNRIQASRRLHLCTQALVAIDGSKFRAVNHGDQNFTAANLEQRLAQIDESIASPEPQVSLIDPDARSMKNCDGGIVSYNVQAAVDAQHHLFVAHEVVTEGVDRDQLTPVARDRTAVGLGSRH